MILFVGQVGNDFMEREAFQEIDYRRMFGPMAKWVAQIDRCDRIPEFIARAYATATSGRPGPVVLALPEDTLWGTATVPDMPRYQRVPNHPGAPDLERLRAALDAARHPFLLLAAAAGPPGRSSASPPSPSPSSCRSARPGGGWNASTSAIPTPPARSAGA